MPFFRNELVRGICELKRDWTLKDWKKLKCKELRNLCASPNIIRIIKSMIMRLIGHVAFSGEEKA